jgi:hypothetical protein
MKKNKPETKTNSEPISIDYCPACGTHLTDIKHKILPTERDYLSMRLKCPKQKITLDILIIKRN